MNAFSDTLASDLFNNGAYVWKIVLVLYTGNHRGNNSKLKQICSSFMHIRYFVSSPIIYASL